MLTVDIETSGLDPTNTFITMVGTMDNDGVRIFSSPASEFRKDPQHAEKQLLQRLSNADFRFTDVLLSFNGISFDQPFLRTRMMAHKLTPPAFVATKHHIDLMLFATHLNGGTRISKDMAASKFCNLYVPKNSSGAWLASIYSQQIVTDAQHFSAIGHNSQDLITTYQMLEVWKTFPSFGKFYSSMFPNLKEWLYE